MKNLQLHRNNRHPIECCFQALFTKKVKGDRGRQQHAWIREINNDIQPINNEVNKQNSKTDFKLMS